MKTEYVLDTTILVDHLRGVQEARTFLDSHLSKSAICCISVTELLSGAFGKETAKAESLIRAFGGRVFQVSVESCRIAGRWLARYKAYDHVIDFIIAGVAETHGCRIQTSNIRHFPMFKGLKPPY